MVRNDGAGGCSRDVRALRCRRFCRCRCRCPRCRVRSWCDLLLSLMNARLHLGFAVTTIHFINCSDVYEGLLMKGGLYGLESWRTTPQLNY